MARWQKKTLKIKPDHSWRCTPGYKICVIDRGALQFEFPAHWITRPGENSIKVHDKTPPDDDFVLEVSVLRFPPLEEAPGPTLESLLLGSPNKRKRGLTEADVQRFPREDAQVVWVEYDEMDKEANRMATWKQAITHARTAYGILTFGHWADLKEEGGRLWRHFLQTVILDRPVEDPTRGPLLH